VKMEVGHLHQRYPALSVAPDREPVGVNPFKVCIFFSFVRERTARASVHTCVYAGPGVIHRGRRGGWHFHWLRAPPNQGEQGHRPSLVHQLAHECRAGEVRPR